MQRLKDGSGLDATSVQRLRRSAAVVPNSFRITHHPRFVDDPFTLGVASGDPTPNGGVL